MIVVPSAGCTHIDSHAREVLIDERLLLPDDGVVYLNWKLAGWLAAIPVEAPLIGDPIELAGCRSTFDAYAMLVPTAFGFIITVSLRSQGARPCQGGSLPAGGDGPPPAARPRKVQALRAGA